MMLIAQIFVYAFYLYLLIGLLFAVWFTFKGVAKVDTAMNEASWKVKLLLLPGSMALWPVLLNKYLKTRKK